MQIWLIALIIFIFLFIVIGIAVIVYIKLNPGKKKDEPPPPPGESYFSGDPMNLIGKEVVITTEQIYLSAVPSCFFDDNNAVKKETQLSKTDNMIWTVTKGVPTKALYSFGRDTLVFVNKKYPDLNLSYSFYNGTPVTSINPTFSPQSDNFFVSPGGIEGEYLMFITPDGNDYDPRRQFFFLTNKTVFFPDCGADLLTYHQDNQLYLEKDISFFKFILV